MSAAGGFCLGVGAVRACAAATPSMPELVYGFALDCGCAVLVLLCAIVLRLREPRFAYGLAWGAAAGTVVAFGVVVGATVYVVSNHA